MTPLFSNNSLLTEPMLQDPTSGSVTVVWFTDQPGQDHYVEYGKDFSKLAVAEVFKLSRMREGGSNGEAWTFRPVYKQEAILEGITEKTPYRTVTVTTNGETLKSKIFHCSPTPNKGSPLKILFTSDHQGKPMVAANLQKVKEVVPEIDAIFYAGDCVDHADKASEWFDENGFFACLQGKAHKQLHSSIYSGGALLQTAPLFCAIGNHEVMGQWSKEKNLEAQFNDPYPRELAKARFKQLFPHQNDPMAAEKWIKDHSFNIDSYDQIFTLPTSSSGNKKYYAVTFGDIRLVVLYATRIWRRPELGIKGKYTELPATFDQPLEWGHGDFIFEPIQKGSAQYLWLEKELQSSEFQNAKYKIVMLHNPFHTLGENGIPPFTTPIQQITTDENGKITAISYDYPIEQDFLIRDLEPLFVRYEVDLVLCGHTHIWNRFRSPEGMHHLETSNVGNSYGAYLTISRNLVPGKGDDNYRAFGDPNGLTPILPTIAPLKNAEGIPLPYISSNTITVFSIFSTDTGAVDSYYFDTMKSDSSVVHFDRFYLGQRKPAYHIVRSISDLKEYAEKTALPDLIVSTRWDYKNHLIYFVDDRKSHLEDYHRAFQAELALQLFEYTYSHSQ